MNKAITYLHCNGFFISSNRSTLIRLSFPTLDANNSEYYPLRAGHIASWF